MRSSSLIRVVLIVCVLISVFDIIYKGRNEMSTNTPLRKQATAAYFMDPVPEENRLKGEPGVSGTNEMYSLDPGEELLTLAGDRSKSSVGGERCHSCSCKHEHSDQESNTTRKLSSLTAYTADQ
jgi:hypothetical protein